MIPKLPILCHDCRYRRTGNPAPDSWRYIASKGAAGFKTQVLINTQAGNGMIHVQLNALGNHTIGDDKGSGF